MSLSQQSLRLIQTTKAALVKVNKAAEAAQMFSLKARGLSTVPCHSAKGGMPMEPP